MAPEVMKGLNHTGSVDYFAVGIITYELMLGKRPYIGKNRKEIKEQMMIKQVYLDEDIIPYGWSQYAADFINRLLIRKDINRLGYYNDLEVKSHPWLKTINFDDLINFKILSPFIPRRNYDNYDKKYCEEIEQIGVDTNIKYDKYKNNSKYIELFEGFTFYKVDESQFIQYNEIYRKPNVKYTKNNLNLNKNNNEFFRKSRTISLDYDYNNKIEQNLFPLQNYIPSSTKKIPNSNRTINYSNANNSTNRKTPTSNIKINHNKSNSSLNNSKYSFKNKEDIYIMASPFKRGRIINNSNDNNIDNSFRKYANHSFVETNCSKGKILKKSYSSSNLQNNNHVNIFNLLVNNVNNINNNNIINNNNERNKDKYIYSHNSKLSSPISYNKINKSKIPFDRRPNCQYKNYNNYNNMIYHNHHKSFIEKPKNYSFYSIDNENISYNYNNNYNSIYKYTNKNLSNIFNESLEENNIKNKDNEFKNNHPNYYVKQKIPHSCTRKIVTINLKDKKKENNYGTINFDYSNKSYNNVNINKIKTIDYINIGNIQIILFMRINMKIVSILRNKNIDIMKNQKN